VEVDPEVVTEGGTAMRTRCWIAAGILGLVLSPAVHAQDEVKVAGRVVDAAGKPVAGAEVTWFWSIQDNKMDAYKGVTTNAEGHFTVAVPFFGRSQALLALNKDRKTGGLIVLDEKAAAKPVEIKLGPLVHVHGRFSCKELNKRPKWTNVYLYSDTARFFTCSSTEASFSFHLPPGTYKFRAYGTDIQDVKKDITLKADERDLDLKTIDISATILAKHVGKAPPAWHVTDARGVKREVHLSDFKGKWVLIEFWGHW
jgi:hypothetical protein